MGGADQDMAIDVCVDNAGNSLVVGTFKGTCAFQFGSGLANLTSNGGSDSFLCKLDPSGNLLWVKSIGGANEDVVLAADIDASGNFYLTGYFSGTMDIDPGTGSSFLNTPSASTENTFVLKVDNNGNFLWGKSFGADRGHAIVVTTDGVLIGGGFWFTEDMDPGSGVYNLTSQGLWDAFLVKLDFNGNFMIATSFGGTGVEVAGALDIDLNGNILVAGEMSGGGQADFNPGTSSYYLTSQIASSFVCKLDGNLNFLWAKNLPESGGSATEVACDNNGNVYAVGQFINTTDFDQGSGVANLSSVGFYDAYLWKMDANGNYLWAKNIGAIGADFGHSLAMTQDGKIFIGGEFQASFSTDFDPGPGIANLEEFGGGDVFILQFDSNGNYVWGGTMGGASNYENPYSMAVGPNNALYTVGRFAATIDANPFSAIQNITSAGNDDIFVLKMNVGSTNEINELEEDFLQIFPNPTGGKLETLFGWNSITIRSSDGKIVLSKQDVCPQHSLNIEQLEKGVYFISFDNKNEQTFRVIKQ
jgi:hypothetical protein